MPNDNRIKGKLYAIGLGPGDPDLLTVKAVKILNKVDSIVVPKARIKSDSVARDIVTRALGPDLPFVEMVFPMSRDKSELESHWDKAADALLYMLNKGEDVAFVTLGDVSLYSTFSYLEKSLKRKDSSVRAELVPGISSIQLAAIRFETPLALGDENYGVYPLPENISDLDKALEDLDNLMIMKIGNRLGELKSYLEEKGLLNQSRFIRRAGFPDEFICHDLSELDEKESGYLSIIMVKKGV
ncbi:MAG: precorrin-2 C(20)-methyltransferase [Spirochaetaceae bacterium]|jgi:precorrin-2/cobalt-factor-2 C20-methyltransferase|nr:precorrin-2 C(20)-methyltransferase [Spirochaetaceae bacterium]